MPRMSNRGRAISMTRSDTWVTSFADSKGNEYEAFCHTHCPHKDEECEGDCPEMKEYRKIHKRRVHNGN